MLDVPPAMIRNSIKWRFVLWLAFLLVCVLSGFGITAYQLYRTNRFERLDEELKKRVAVLSATLRAPPLPGDRGGPRNFGDDQLGPPPQRRPPPPDDSPGPRSENRAVHLSTEARNLFDESAMNTFYYTFWSRSGGAVLASSAHAPLDLPRPAQPGKDTGTYLRLRGTVREAWHYTERGDCVLVGRSITTELAATRRFAAWLIVGGVAILALGISGVWLLAGRALKPVAEISTAASRISAGNLSERINASAADNELGQLANTLNSTFARLEAAFAQQKHFTADASHELRTPLAVMISEAQTTLARERSATEYRETVQACLDTAQQMRKLTESLLQLARLDAGQENVRRDAVDLAEIARNGVELLHRLADERGLRIFSELKSAATRGDADLLTRVITNLIANAIQYNKPNGEIRLVTRTVDSAAELTVANTGPGIAPEDAPHIFERFYRADKARGRLNRNSGLGLAICKSILDAHGGSIEVSSEPGGTTIRVRLP